MAKRKGRIVALFNKQSGLCFYCKEEMELQLDGSHLRTATIEHLIPKKQIGRAFRDFNEVAACWECNNRKSDMPVIDFISILEK